MWAYRSSGTAHKGRKSNVERETVRESLRRFNVREEDESGSGMGGMTKYSQIGNRTPIGEKKSNGNIADTPYGQ